MPEKTGQRLVLMDGTTIENGACGYADGVLWCWVHGYTMQEAAGIFFDPHKTGRIVYEYGEMADTYVGYTICVNIFTDESGQVSIGLRKEA